jgi:hypothetical protein
MLVIVCCLGQGCGGGGGGDAGSTPPGTPVPAGSTLSGTAAVGAALALAEVQVRDAAGTLRSATTDANGAYSLDVSGLRAPLLVRVSGNAAGLPVVLHSFVPAVDAGTTNLNVTPLTEAALALASARIPREVFEAPVLSSLSAARESSAVASLNTALSGVLGGIGMTSADFLGDPFVPDQQGMDKLLELVDVVVDQSTSGVRVQLANKLAPAQRVSLVIAANGTVTSSGALSLSTEDAGVFDLASLRDFSADLEAAFAAGPSASAIGALVANDYAEYGLLKAGVVAQLASALYDDAEVLPLSIRSCDVAAMTCTVSLGISLKDGTARRVDETLQQQEDGSWLIFGNHRAYPLLTYYRLVKPVSLSAAVASPAPFGQLVIAVDSGNIGMQSIEISAVSGDTTAQLHHFAIPDGQFSQTMSIGLGSTVTGKILAANGHIRITVTHEDSSIRTEDFYLPLPPSTAPFPALTSAALELFRVWDAGQSLSVSWTTLRKDSPVSRVTSRLGYPVADFQSSTAVSGVSSATLQGNAGGALELDDQSDRKLVLSAEDRSGHVFETIYCGGANIVSNCR